MVDDDEAARRLGRLQLQSELLFEGGKDRRCPRDAGWIGIRSIPGIRIPGRVLINGILQDEIELVGDTGFIKTFKPPRLPPSIVRLSRVAPPATYTMFGPSRRP